MEKKCSNVSRSEDMWTHQWSEKKIQYIRIIWILSFPNGIPAKQKSSHANTSQTPEVIRRSPHSILISSFSPKMWLLCSIFHKALPFPHLGSSLHDSFLNKAPGWFPYRHIAPGKYKTGKIAGHQIKTVWNLWRTF